MTASLAIIATHTQGKWKIHTEGKKTGILTENNVEHLATCYGFRKEQNARLIVAAPSLLNALIAIKTQAELTSLTFPNAPGRGDLLTIARIAGDEINKAKGNA
jgi:hypothetical protein